MTHYSFDFAQQVHFPSNPMQPGPMYFKTPRKCGVFGVMAEGPPQMVLFLLDEAVETGKGASTVISLLDFFLEDYGLKEVACHLHADNCSGQNKNNAMLHYLMWRVVTGRHNITLSFSLPGHTKFGPDWCLGLREDSAEPGWIVWQTSCRSPQQHRPQASSHPSCAAMRQATCSFQAETGRPSCLNGSGSWWA